MAAVCRSLAQLAAANKTEHKAERQQSQLEERRAIKKKKKKKKGGDFLGGVQSRKGSACARSTDATDSPLLLSAVSKNAENRKSFKTRPGKGKGGGARYEPLYRVWCCSLQCCVQCSSSTRVVHPQLIHENYHLSSCGVLSLIVVKQPSWEQKDEERWQRRQRQCYCTWPKGSCSY